MKFSKEKLQFVKNNWGTMHADEMSERLGVCSNTIYRWVRHFKSLGGELPTRTIKRGPKKLDDNIFNSLI